MISVCQEWFLSYVCLFLSTVSIVSIGVWVSMISIGIWVSTVSIPTSIVSIESIGISIGLRISRSLLNCLAHNLGCCYIRRILVSIWVSIVIRVSRVGSEWIVSMSVGNSWSSNCLYYLLGSMVDQRSSNW